jgi:PIN domain nuclease of toxin-antitoxin system
VRLLLDTHIVLWSLADRPRLWATARALLADTATECWVSAASLREIASRVVLGKHRLRFALVELESAVDDAGDRVLCVSARHALAIERIRIPQETLSIACSWRNARSRLSDCSPLTGC